MDGSQAINPYLVGNFAPVRSEDDFELEVTGQIPAALAGTFYRNGPNPQFEPRDAYHWFSGDGMIHGFFVEDGKVSYLNRYVRTPKWELEHGAAKSLFGTFGNPMTTDPSWRMGTDSVRRQHQYRLARRQAACARRRPSAFRARSGYAAIARLPRRIPRWQGDRAPETRSRDRRDGPGSPTRLARRR